MVSIIRWARLPAILMTALLGLALSVGSVAAASSTTSQHLPNNDDLQRVFRLRQTQLQYGTNQLAAENAYAANLAATIATLQQQGKDVTDLVNGLARFRNQIATGQTAWQHVSDLLTTHAGFDAQGNVIDKGQANWTLESAHTSLLLMKQTANNAKNDLNDLLHRYGRIYDVPFGSHPAEDAF
jgi:hypothetical protein